jgi:hypothetical protein
MSLTPVLYYHPGAGLKPALAAPFARKRGAIVLLDGEVRVRYLDEGEYRALRPGWCDVSKRDPVARFRKLAREWGATQAAKEFLHQTEEV